MKSLIVPASALAFAACSPAGADAQLPQVATGSATGGPTIDGPNLAEQQERDQGGDGTSCGSNLTGVVRDFNSTHPDFQFTNCLGADCEREWLDKHEAGLVAQVLGEDGKPVYAGRDDDHPVGTYTTSGPDEFVQWYNDVDGVNMRTEHELVFEQNPATQLWVFESTRFFPIDGMLFAEPGFVDSDGVEHNFHFTFELHTEFRYEPGQVFSFHGDDDVWVFINDQLVVDIGGVHARQLGSVDLDTLGLDAGGIYSMDLFHAERKTTQSNFKIETNLVFTRCGVLR